MTDKMKRKSSLAVIILIALSMISFLVSCGASVGEVELEEGSAFTDGAGWDYFESFNPIGYEYSDVADMYDLSEDICRDGGITLQVDYDDLYFGFPAVSEDEIQEDDPCTAVYGTLKTVFGIEDDCYVEDLENLLNVSFDDEYEGSLITTAARGSGNYYVTLYVTDSSAYLIPDDGISIVYREDDRIGSDSVPSEEVYVDMHAVDSSVFHQIGYDSQHEILAVVFEDSQELWYYYGVPEDVYYEFENSDSLGSYYNEYIKGVYASAEQY